MAAVNIVIRAINSTKGAFQEVGNQASMLNKRLQKIVSVFKGLFLGGMVVQFGKKLLEASSYTKQLEDAGGRVKSAWSGVSTDIGDAFARIVLSIEPLIASVGKFFGNVIGEAQKGASVITALLTGSSLSEALTIGEETLDQIRKEQEERRAAASEAEAAAKEQEDAQKRINELYDERFKLEQDLNKERKKAEESAMTEEQILARRKKELEQAKARRGAVIDMPGLSDEENAALADVQKLNTEIEIVNLQEEIGRMERAAADALAKADEKATKKKSRGHGRIIKFNRDAIEMGRRSANDMQSRTDARMQNLAKTDPSWKSANYLKSINDKMDSLLSMKE